VTNTPRDTKTILAETIRFTLSKMSLVYRHGPHKEFTITDVAGLTNKGSALEHSFTLDDVEWHS